jgi:hypothetical protein
MQGKNPVGQSACLPSRKELTVTNEYETRWAPKLETVLLNQVSCPSRATNSDLLAVRSVANSLGRLSYPGLRHAVFSRLERTTDLRLAASFHGPME